MPSEKDKIVEFKHYMKFDKMPYIIYGDIESLIKKIGGCENNPEKSQQQKQTSIFLVDIQCQQFGDLITQKTNILYIAEEAL